MWREGLIVVFIITYFMWQFHMMRRNRMGSQKVAPKEQRCLALIDGINGHQCSRFRRRKMVCCSQHDEIVYSGQKQLDLIDEEDRDPYAEGADAGCDSDNPYPLTSDQSMSWNDGFISTHEEE